MPIAYRMTTQDVDNLLANMLTSMEGLAQRHIKHLAVLVMANNPLLSRFKMGMGMAVFEFHDTEEDNLILNDGIHSGDIQELENFLGDWDDVLKITGTGMYIYPDGSISYFDDEDE